jgi:hypothetical protein
MGKLRLSVHRKNEQQKKYGGLYRVRMPRDIVSVMPVSIPLNVLSYRVTLPLSLFSATPVCSLSTLRKRMLEMSLLPQGKSSYTTTVVHNYTCRLYLTHTGWIETLGGSGVHQLVFCKLTSNSDQISLAIKIAEDFSWSLQVHSRSIEPHACSILRAVPQSLVSAKLVGQLICQLEHSSICPGNPDEKFFSLAAS